MRRLRHALPAATLAAIVLFAVSGNLLTPFAPDASSLLDRNLPPVSMGGNWI